MTATCSTSSAMIYLDYAATTALHPNVLEVMRPFFTEMFGNPSSTHHFGRAARLAIDDARMRLAGHLSCKPHELIFTSGGTESNNLAIFGAIDNPLESHLITSQIEHHAVLHVCRQLEEQGCEVTYLPVDEQGTVSVSDCAAAIRPNTRLISIMLGNNEVGTLQPIAEIGRLAQANHILMHTDAVQALGNIELDLSQLPIDLLSLSAHKIRGPKGCGALYVRHGTPLKAQLFGGSQERKRRAGTENVAAIVGFAEATSLATEQLAKKRAWTSGLRQLFLTELTNAIGQHSFVVNSPGNEQSLSHILNISFPGIRTETMLMNLDLQGVAVSSGSACSAGSLETSHVLRAMCLAQERLTTAIRFSFAYETTEKEILQTVEKVETIFTKLRIK